ncbi:MAG: CDP-alcohol phosphatidyltransferase family protein [Nanoarchaeota archaeon]
MKQKKNNSKGSISKKQENWLAKYTYRQIANPIAVQLAKINMTSVQISILSIITSLAACIYFSFGQWKFLAAGYIFFQLTIILDHIDGAIARHTGNQTMVGSWFDKFSNKIHRFLFVFGATLGVYKTTGDPVYLILGNIAGFMWIFASYISETKRVFFKFKEDATLFGESRYKYIFPFTLIVSNIFGLLILIGKPVIALWFVAIVSMNAFQQIYSAHKYWSKEKYIKP